MNKHLSKLDFTPIAIVAAMAVVLSFTAVAGVAKAYTESEMWNYFTNLGNTSGVGYSLSDVDSVVKTTVSSGGSTAGSLWTDAGDVSLTRYVINLKNGTEHTVVRGPEPLQSLYDAIGQTGFSGTPSQLIALAKTGRDTDENPYDLENVISVVGTRVDPSTRNGDEYTRYVIKLSNGAIHVVNRYSTQAGAASTPYALLFDRAIVASGFSGKISKLLALVGSESSSWFGENKSDYADLWNGGSGYAACTADARQCADGSWVGRTGPNCEFVCPTTSGENDSYNIFDTKFWTVNTGNAEEYTLADVRSVTSRYVDPIPQAADDEYTLYVITLTDGTVHRVKLGFTTQERFHAAIRDTGYSGDIDALLEKAVKATVVETKTRLDVAPKVGAAPLTVTFVTYITGQAGQVEILYGDGESEALDYCEAPADKCLKPGINKHTYDEPGTYIVEVKWSTGANAGTIIATETVVVTETAADVADEKAQERIEKLEKRIEDLKELLEELKDKITAVRKTAVESDDTGSSRSTALNGWGPWCEIDWSRPLTVGSRGEDVRRLQLFLNSHPATQLASGDGAPGLETDYFGPKTAEALARFQARHPEDILAKAGIATASGFFGGVTQDWIGRYCAQFKPNN